MDPFGIGLGIGVASSAYSWFNSRDQAAAMRRQTEENLRRLRVQQAQQSGATTAAGAASGYEFDSESLQAHLSAMKSEFERQADWTRRAGMAAADATATAGNLSLVTDLGGSFFKYADANNWFKTPTVK